MSFGLGSLMKLLPVSLRGGGDPEKNNEKRLAQILQQAIVTQADGIRKSVSDTREYRTIKLDNELEAMLVSDPKTEVSAAALSVNVGSYSDPKELPGLAHFLEHMLFMGTKKYPDENEYSQFLSENGGYSNAYTGGEITNYHFEVISNQFFSALDKFAQFFVAPLLSPSGTERELKAVDNECTGNAQNDMWRAYLIYRELAHKDHPVHKFNIGNLETLKHEPEKKGIKVREALLEFYDKYYSANQMKLVVVGQQSLDELEKNVVTMFSEVPNKKIPNPLVHPDPSGPAFDAKNLGKIVKVVPVMDRRKVEIIWNLSPLTYGNSRREASDYLCALFGDEGEGSILSYLKKKSWANALSAGVNEDNYDLATLEVTIDCTNDGITNHVNDIVEVVYNYVNMLKDAFSRPKECERYFEEEKILAAIGFWFKSDAQPMRLAVSQAAYLQKDIPIKDSLVTRSLKLRDVFVEVVEITKELTTENSLVFISWKEFEKETNKEEEYFKTKYRVEDLPSQLKQTWSTASEYKSLGLSLTVPNRFIPSSFDVKTFEKPKKVKVPTTSTSFLKKAAEQNTVSAPKQLLHASNPDKVSVASDLVERSLSEVWDEDTFRRPLIIHADNVSTLWLKQDTTHKKPKCTVNMVLRTPFLMESLSVQYAVDVYISMVKDVLNEVTYAASSAGFSYWIRSSKTGIYIDVSGFAETIDAYVELIATKLRSFMNEKPNEALFTRFKERKIKSTLNLDKVRPVSLASISISEALDELSVSIEAKKRAAEQLDLSDVLKVSAKLFDNVSIEMLVCGNARTGEALKVMKIAQKIFEPKRNISELDTLRTVNLLKQERSQTFLIQAARNPDDLGSAMYAQFQLGTLTPEKNAFVDLFSEVLYESFFNKLRTQQSLGYIVSAFALKDKGIVSLTLYVESNSADPIELNERLEKFIDEMEKDFDVDITEEKFKDLKNAALSNAIKRTTSVQAESDRWFKNIASGLYDLNNNFELCEHLLKFTRNDLKALLQEYVFKGAPKRAKFVSGVLADVHGKKLFGEKEYEALKPKVKDNVRLNFGEKVVTEWLQKDKKFVEGRGKVVVVEDTEAFRRASAFFPNKFEIFSKM